VAPGTTTADLPITTAAMTTRVTSRDVTSWTTFVFVSLLAWSLASC
jgi:hypothetical protein